MFLGIQPNLVERTVFEAVRTDPSLRPHYERQFADCYRHRQGHLRDQAFAELHERWFNELGFRDRIAGLVNEFPHFNEQVARLMVAQAPGPKAQAAELFGAPEQYTVVVAVSPASLLDESGFQYWARHEFQHIDDMLNPTFGYDVAKRPAGATTAARNLIQDRYAVLWALSVDARLAQRGQVPTGVRESRHVEFMRAFALKDTESVRHQFDDRWREAESLLWNHRKLLEWAQDGLRGLDVNEAGAGDAAEGPPPGAPCPLCRFPTFDWAECSRSEQILQAVHQDFPDWTPTDGICGRCAEVYHACADSLRLTRV